MINLKSKKGITVAALTITILLFLMILSTITFSSLSSVQIKKLNNMYSDIISLQEKIDLYYLKNGVLPVQDGSGKITYSAENDSNLKWLAQRNPNDGNDYYEITSDTITKLGGLALNNSKSDDKYYINAVSHTIYYSNGVQTEENAEKIYTIDLSEYQAVDLKNYQ